MKIADIQIGNRHRRDMGDLEGLARSMDELGLLHPVVVRPDGMLIAGERRLAAARMLGWTDVPVTVIDLESVLRGEWAENAQRKDFTPSEAVAIGQALEPLERAAAKERMLAGQPSANFTQGRAPQSLDRVAAALGMSRPTYERAKAVVEAAEAEPDVFGDIAAKMDQQDNVNGAYKAMRAAIRERERAAMADAAKALPETERWHVETADISVYRPSLRFDFIITDPPYPREHLRLYGVLAKRAHEWLKPGGLLLAMCGQSYLDQIMAQMGEHLAYYWTGCYLTPGQPTPLRTRQVNTTWKPVLCYGLPGQSYSGKIFGDVWTSLGNDKEHHYWGQSESGMLAIISQVCLPGQTIFDPFMGAGTTGVAALRHGCIFHGIDIEEQNVDLSRRRLAEIL